LGSRRIVTPAVAVGRARTDEGSLIVNHVNGRPHRVLDSAVSQTLEALRMARQFVVRGGAGLRG
jgi:hypothetical protein